MNEVSEMSNNFIIMGPAGSGKGTQAKLLSKKLNLPHISTGVMCREIREQDTELGRKVKQMHDAGVLVTDEIMFEILLERFKNPDIREGFVLDGFPRNLNQAEFLERHKPINRVIFLEVSEEEVIRRMTARRVCSKCKAEYNIIYIKLKQEGICDKCGGKLIQRADDNPDSIRERLNEFYEQTILVINFYDKKGILLRVNGERPIEKVFEEMVAGLEK